MGLALELNSGASVESKPNVCERAAAHGATNRRRNERKTENFSPIRHTVPISRRPEWDLGVTLADFCPRRRGPERIDQRESGRFIILKPTPLIICPADGHPGER
ncbi:hypothetical protein EVAR_94707_1 [Eumeta japonica]|uniref:Uncharacterized protein n=1 Tax=Eumeta variegata TaxID=151549 RepID=A0A4C1UWY6_EUMVA|nr:hypothetical protein EVAR_94707_1 [Eumeta japonica]